MGKLGKAGTLNQEFAQEYKGFGNSVRTGLPVLRQIVRLR